MSNDQTTISSEPQTPQFQALTARIWVCPFCAYVRENADAGGACPKCTLDDTPANRRATAQKIGPWFVLQYSNPTAPGMKYSILMMLASRGKITPASIVRGPTTQQYWTTAGQVRGLSRLFGLCWHCQLKLSSITSICPHCDHSQEPPPDPNVFLELSHGNARESAVMREISGLDTPRAQEEATSIAQSTMQSLVGGPGLIASAHAQIDELDSGLVGTSNDRALRRDVGSGRSAEDNAASNRMQRAGGKRPNGKNSEGKTFEGKTSDAKSNVGKTTGIKLLGGTRSAEEAIMSPKDLARAFSLDKEPASAIARGLKYRKGKLMSGVRRVVPRAVAVLVLVGVPAGVGLWAMPEWRERASQFASPVLDPMRRSGVAFAQKNLPESWSRVLVGVPMDVVLQTDPSANSTTRPTWASIEDLTGRVTDSATDSPTNSATNSATNSGTEPPALPMPFSVKPTTAPNLGPTILANRPLKVADDGVSVSQSVQTLPGGNSGKPTELKPTEAIPPALATKISPTIVDGDQAQVPDLVASPDAAQAAVSLLRGKDVLPEPSPATASDLSTAEQQARLLWTSALQAEGRGDFALAILRYETIRTLPAEVRQSNLELRLALARLRAAAPIAAPSTRPATTQPATTQPVTTQAQSK